MSRIVQPEFLDTLPPQDPRAMRSRRDLVRVNAWMGNAGIMTRAIKANSPTPQRIVELGAGDGNFLLRVAKKSGWKNVNATLLDLQKNTSTETLTAFSKTGWKADAVVADVFEWNGSGDIIVANLFLHHFEDERLAALLKKISERTGLFVAVEPHRFAYPSPCGQLLWLIGCNDVTRHDAVVSIRAGFIRKEISALWPDKQRWQLTERRAGLFSHLFIARRIS